MTKSYKGHAAAHRQHAHRWHAHTHTQSPSFHTYLVSTFLGLLVQHWYSLFWYDIRICLLRVNNIEICLSGIHTQTSTRARSRERPEQPTPPHNSTGFEVTKQAAPAQQLWSDTLPDGGAAQQALTVLRKAKGAFRQPVYRWACCQLK